MVKLLAQSISPSDAAGLIVVLGTFIFATFLVWIGFNLMKSGNRPEKGGFEMVGLKFNLETTSGGFCIAFAAVVVINFLSKFYGR
ncbi:MAG: hypothetical protein HEQ35_21155 [Gloeotrichia echinulata IR180]|jgi:hypothetical protein|nr:hypothetical protein [Gloeotrichia echinulata DEX184]